ncbi:hypothetical protein VOLCADRAFT_98985 [Volvox carteri f. nagariensis]|uniref:Uncharacterized protein n=1 Tax=Volvox carteri f. nagariensis TaxID=3068 RepID=D8UGR7_VOLCA|nr:uncharacterized protein VOLCADRAFT_98985 [Volvox carteri f. nagariensis]EFJ41075.1 hypothetical protein VOLCADRAFT_98985 [Volvox carteri f. nagariensis]|eukprot:XP_002957838.1 hypothetical protein VOLCADRAFT_98985 [Volvox carteri f. nagariensis]
MKSPFLIVKRFAYQDFSANTVPKALNGFIDPYMFRCYDDELLSTLGLRPLLRLLRLLCCGRHLLLRRAGSWPASSSIDLSTISLLSNRSVRFRTYSDTAERDHLQEWFLPNLQSFAVQYNKVWDSQAWLLRALTMKCRESDESGQCQGRSLSHNGVHVAPLKREATIILSPYRVVEVHEATYEWFYAKSSPCMLMGVSSLKLRPCLSSTQQRPQCQLQSSKTSVQGWFNGTGVASAPGHGKGKSLPGSSPLWVPLLGHWVSHCTIDIHTNKVGSPNLHPMQKHQCIKRVIERHTELRGGNFLNPTQGTEPKRDPPSCHVSCIINDKQSAHEGCSIGVGGKQSTRGRRYVPREERVCPAAALIAILKIGTDSHIEDRH